MNKSLYWKWDNEITPERCKEIIDSAGDKFHTAQIGGEVENTNKTSINLKTRKTNIHWINDDQKLYKMANNYGLSANQQAEWNFNFSSMESFQIGQYSKGGHYEWHIDGLGIYPINAPNNKFLHGKTRKISMVLWLNDDFEGGEFEFHPSVLRENRIIKPSVGTIIMFPSWIMHRVRPVTSGIRYSAVTWLLGNPVI
jgi:PKHD-type hydroxylase